MPLTIDADQLKQRAAGIRLAVFDVDGVLTDGGLYYHRDGSESKRFHVHDGLGLKRLISAGLDVAVITARRSEVVALRMAELGVAHVYQGEAHKLGCLRGLCERLGVKLSEVCYTGDDAPDVECMGAVGLACSVADGTIEAHQAAHWISRRKGGQGAAREVCQLLLNARTAVGRESGSQ